MRHPFQPSAAQKEVALTIGLVCMQWASIEGGIDEFIQILAPFETDEIAHVFSGNMGLPEKLQTLRALAFVRNFDNDWLNDVLFLLNHIDNDIRVRRNGFVHAQWYTPGPKIFRQTKKTKILKPQSFKLSLEVKQVFPIRKIDLQMLIVDMQEAEIALLPLIWYMIGSDGKIFEPKGEKFSYKRYLREARLGNPIQKIRAKLRNRKKRPHR